MTPLIRAGSPSGVRSAVAAMPAGEVVRALLDRRADLGFASLPVEQNHEIEVTEFVPADQVDPVAFDNAYFLEPASRSNRAYVLMREALQQTDRLAICTFTLRRRMCIV